jgi:hypothetical protein
VSLEEKNLDTEISNTEKLQFLFTYRNIPFFYLTGLQENKSKDYGMGIFIIDYKL